MKPRIWIGVLVLMCLPAQSRAELVVMKFEATWCRGCVIQTKHFQTKEVQKVLKAHSIVVWHFDADKHPEAHEKYKVEAMPYMRLVDFDRKKNTARTVRATAQGQLIPEDKLPAWLTPPKGK